MPTTNPLKAPSIALIGPYGSGKTHSLITLLEAGIEVFDVILEPNALDTILDQIRKHPKSAELMNKFHWTTVSVSSANWDQMRDTMKKIGAMHYDDLAKTFKDTKKTSAYITDLLDAVNNFHCERTGDYFGDVATWDDNRALVLDGLSGINRIARLTAVGGKPTPAMGEWGVMMNIEDAFLYKLCSECWCYFVLIAHVNKFVDEISGTTSVQMRAVTNSLGQDIGKNFSEVVLAKRMKDKFFWSTSENITDVKNRALPISDSLAPDFGQIVKVHEERKRSIVVPASGTKAVPVNPQT